MQDPNTKNGEVIATGKRSYFLKQGGSHGRIYNAEKGGYSREEALQRGVMRNGDKTAYKTSS